MPQYSLSFRFGADFTKKAGPHITVECDGKIVGRFTYQQVGEILLAASQFDLASESTGKPVAASSKPEASRTPNPSQEVPAPSVEALRAVLPEVLEVLHEVLESDAIPDDTSDMVATLLDKLTKI